MSTLDTMTLAQIKSLNLHEQLLASQELWASIASSGIDIEVSSYEEEILKSRDKKYRKTGETIPWDSAKAELDRKYKS